MSHPFDRLWRLVKAYTPRKPFAYGEAPVPYPRTEVTIHEATAIVELVHRLTHERDINVDIAKTETALSGEAVRRAALAEAEIERLTRELAEARAHRDEAQKTLTAISEVIGSWANVGRGLVEAVRAVVTERDTQRLRAEKSERELIAVNAACNELKDRRTKVEGELAQARKDRDREAHDRQTAEKERAALRAMMPSAEEREAIGVAARWTLFVTPASSYVSTIDAWLSRLSPPSAPAQDGGE